jgi:hypothetical protein
MCQAINRPVDSWGFSHTIRVPLFMQETSPERFFPMSLIILQATNNPKTITLTSRGLLGSRLIHKPHTSHLCDCALIESPTTVSSRNSETNARHAHRDNVVGYESKRLVYRQNPERGIWRSALVLVERTTMGFIMALIVIDLSISRLLGLVCACSANLLKRSSWFSR